MNIFAAEAHHASRRSDESIQAQVRRLNENTAADMIYPNGRTLRVIYFVMVSQTQFRRWYATGNLTSRRRSPSVSMLAGFLNHLRQTRDTIQVGWDRHSLKSKVYTATTSIDMLRCFIIQSRALSRSMDTDPHFDPNQIEANSTACKSLGRSLGPRRTRRG